MKDDSGPILITGGTGFLGSALVREARSREYRVLAPGRQELDLLDARAVTTFLETHRPYAVVHAAGKVGGIAANMADPVPFLRDNALMGIHLLEACRNSGIPRVLNVASSCMYPRNATIPLQEESIGTGPLEPSNEGYALAKMIVAKFGQLISETMEGTRVKTLIPCNLYGPGDHFSVAHGHLIAAAMTKMYDAVNAQTQVVDVWGDGTARREFMHVDDAARMTLDALGLFDQLPPLLNLGVDEDRSVREYYELVAAAAGFDGDLKFDDSKPVGVMRKMVDTSRQSTIGLTPKISLSEGIRATYARYAEERSK